MNLIKVLNSILLRSICSVYQHQRAYPSIYRILTDKNCFSFFHVFFQKFNQKLILIPICVFEEPTPDFHINELKYAYLIGGQKNETTNFLKHLRILYMLNQHLVYNYFEILFIAQSLKKWSLQVKSFLLSSLHF